MNTKVSSAKRQNYWFHVTAEIDDKTVSGWVYQTDVNTLMGRSKGQLIAENNRLYDEAVDLRRKLKASNRQLAEARAEIDKLKAELDKARAEIKQLKADLDKARTKDR